ncbi:hypothetical protein P9869_14365 [Streptomyces ossamyceticus]|nr:hypothetical protein [Streptomyces ossamyceticus]
MLACDGLKGLPEAVGDGLTPHHRADLRRAPAAELFRYAARQDWDKITRRAPHSEHPSHRNKATQKS